MKKFLAFKLIPVIFLSSGLLAACSDEPDCPEKTEKIVNVGIVQDAVIPYTSPDTLVFVTSTGDSEYYSTPGKIYYTEKTEQENRSDPACGITHTIHYRSYRIHFNNQENQLSLELSSVKANDLTIKFNSTLFNLWSQAISNRIITDYPILDSIVLHNRVFKDVSMVKSGDDSLYINKSDGIVRLFLAASQRHWDRIY